MAALPGEGPAVGLFERLGTLVASAPDDLDGFDLRVVEPSASGERQTWQTRLLRQRAIEGGPRAVARVAGDALTKAPWMVAGPVGDAERAERASEWGAARALWDLLGDACSATSEAAYAQLRAALCARAVSPTAAEVRDRLGRALAWEPGLPEAALRLSEFYAHAGDLRRALAYCDVADGIVSVVNVPQPVGIGEWLTAAMRANLLRAFGREAESEQWRAIALERGAPARPAAEAESTHRVQRGEDG